VGEAYWLKVRSRLGPAVELHPMLPGSVVPLVMNGVVDAYSVTDGSGVVHRLTADTVVRFFFPDPEYPWQSEGYLGPAGITADTLKFMSQHVRKHYENDAMPKAWLEAGDNAVAFRPDEKDRFYADWAKRYSSRDGDFAGMPGITPTGYKLVELAIQSGAELTPLLEYLRDIMLMNHGVPRSVLGQVVSGDRSSAETNQFVFDLHTITPIARMMEDSITLQLAPDFDSSLFVAFEEFVSPDKAHLLATEQSDLDRKVKSINAVLEARGDDPVEWGELPVGKIGESPYDPNAEPEIPEDNPFALMDEEPPEDDGGEEDEEPPRSSAFPHQRLALYEDLYGGVFEKAMRSIVERQRRETLKKLRGPSDRDFKRISADDLFDPEQWRALFKARIEPLYHDMIGRAANDAMGQVAPAGTVFIFNQEVVTLIDKEAQRLTDRTGDTTRVRIQRQLSEGTRRGESIDQLAARISKVFAGRKKDARTIARTEILKVNQAAQLEGFRQSGVVASKRWNTSKDGKVRDSHIPLDGVTIPMAHDFHVGGELASAPGDPRLSAGNIINCRCFITPVVG
jgi:SPP1 gp7 family putative phage head morphogenesis protein